MVKVSSLGLRPNDTWSEVTAGLHHSRFKVSGYGPIDDKSARGGCQGGGGDGGGEGRVDRWRNVRVLRGVVAE